MYCKFCGQTIDDNSTFCSKCGRDLTDKNQHIQNNENVRASVSERIERENFYKSEKTHKENARKGTIASFVTLMIFILIAFSIELSLLINADKVFRRLPTSDENTIKAILIIAVIAEAILFIINFIKIFPIKNSYICLNENGVYGSGGSSLYFTSKTFQLPYSSITNVKTMSNGVIIESGVDVYKVIINNENDVANMIRERIGLKPEYSVMRSNPTKSVKTLSSWTCPKCGIVNTNTSKCKTCGQSVSAGIGSSESGRAANTWKCPSCGNINQNYVGTCGCGQRKNN